MHRFLDVERKPSLPIDSNASGFDVARDVHLWSGTRGGVLFQSVSGFRSISEFSWFLRIICAPRQQAGMQKVPIQTEPQGKGDQVRGDHQQFLVHGPGTTAYPSTDAHQRVSSGWLEESDKEHRLPITIESDRPTKVIRLSSERVRETLQQRPAPPRWSQVASDGRVDPWYRVKFGMMSITEQCSKVETKESVLAGPHLTVNMNGRF
ncbi:hypothetical protein C8R44DRAFT_746546 [Mycena epipterygia]|nr:hypothetical protein C8R44DRAFT_746546 [Mycena epipterygia]